MLLYANSAVPARKMVVPFQKRGGHRIWTGHNLRRLARHITLEQKQLRRCQLPSVRDPPEVCGFRPQYEALPRAPHVAPHFNCFTNPLENFAAKRPSIATHQQI